MPLDAPVIKAVLMGDVKVLALTPLLYPILTPRCTRGAGAHELVTGIEEKRSRCLRNGPDQRDSHIGSLPIFHHGAAVAGNLAIFLAGDDAYVHTVPRLRYLLLIVLIVLLVERNAKEP